MEVPCSKVKWMISKKINEQPTSGVANLCRMATEWAAELAAFV